MTALECALKLRLIARVAKNVAQKLDRNELWPGELADALAWVARAMSEIKEG